MPPSGCVPAPPPKNAGAVAHKRPICVCPPENTVLFSMPAFYKRIRRDPCAAPDLKVSYAQEYPVSFGTHTGRQEGFMRKWVLSSSSRVQFSLALLMMLLAALTFVGCG